MFQNILPFLIALLIGLFIGIEREHSHPAGSQAMGVRTFILIALIGALAAKLQEPFITLTASLFVFGIILIGYHKSSRTKNQVFTFGITTEVAAGVVYCLGYTTRSEPLLSAIIAIFALVALFSRKKLHVFSRELVRHKEINAAIIILVLGLCILPFLPNATIDHWNIFNPRQYITLVLILAIIEFLGYICIRIFGDNLGILIISFFSGLVSSTSTFLLLIKLSRQSHNHTALFVAAGVLATNAMLIETIILLFFISHQLLFLLLPTLLITIGIGFVITWPIYKKQSDNHLTLLPENPLEIKSVIKLASFILGMLLLITLIKNYVGVHAVHVVSFLGGLFEVHSVNIANATLFEHKKLLLMDAKTSIGLALFSSFLTKFFILSIFARNKFAVYCSLVLLLMLGIGTYSFYLF